MSSEVRITITIPPCYDVPSGKYHDESFIIDDAQWANMMSALKDVEVEIINMWGS